MSRAGVSTQGPLRAKRARQSDPLEQPLSVSQVYYPDDLHRLLRQIGGSDPGSMQREDQLPRGVQLRFPSEPASGSEENSSNSGQTSQESHEETEYRNPDNLEENPRPEQPPLQELSNIIAPLIDSVPTSDQHSVEISSSNLPVVSNGQVNRPEVIDLDKLPLTTRGSTDVVDLTLDTSSTDVSVVDLTVESPRNHVEALPVIVHVHREPSERPSCRFAGPLWLSGHQRSCDDEIQEVPLAQKGGSSKAEEDVDPNSKRAITCPVCLDEYQMIKRRKRQLMSTTCGHIFCDKCIKDAVRLQSKCPTCRKKLSQRQLHPIFL